MLPPLTNQDPGDEGCTDACSICNRPWSDHYADNAKWKMGPFGTFSLIADHLPHVPGVHMERD